MVITGCGYLFCPYVFTHPHPIPDNKLAYLILISTKLQSRILYPVFTKFMLNVLYLLLPDYYYIFFFLPTKWKSDKRILSGKNVKRNPLIPRCLACSPDEQRPQLAGSSWKRERISAVMTITISWGVFFFSSFFFRNTESNDLLIGLEWNKIRLYWKSIENN